MAIDINDHFGKEVQKQRKKQHLSQLQLADKASVDLSTVNRIERGVGNITLRSAFKVTKALHIPIYTFFLTDKDTQRLEKRGEIIGTPVDKNELGK